MIEAARRLLLLRRLVLGAALLVTLASARPAAADSGAAAWRTSFAPAPLAGHLPPVKQGFMVVAAGAESRAAADALGAALRALPASRLVMNDAAIGSVAGLDDAAIVAKAARQPIDVVAVVRVFPGPAGEADRAVVTLYGKDGTVAAAFTALAGTPLEAKAAETPAGAGVGAAASSTVSRVLNTHETRSPAEDQYDATFVSLGDVIAVRGNQAWTTDILKPTQGQYRKPLEWDELYKIIDRPDYSKRYEDARSTRHVVAVLGVLVTVGGIAMIAYAGSLSCGDIDSNPNYFGCQDKQLGWGLGGTLLAVSGPFIIFGGLVSPGNQVPAPELRQAVDQYNRGLRQRLGLPPLADGDEAPPPTARRVAKAGLRFAPVVLGSGPGFVLGGAF
jgi:hypothetical protein